ncbi:complement C3-like [Dreissena polymorpha]|uniref:complement C3-like n=1 Tax=Dreissena polymorpha TaxID=45954 RepID=UPI0022654DE3|nr:complement C3-like [Dreissena polymorpha]
MGIISILLFAACLSSVKGNYQYVLAPNVIRLENEETLLVGILGNGANQKVTVYFEYLDRKISEKTTTIKDAAHPVEVMVKVTADDLFKDIDASPKFRERPKFIKLVCNGPNGIQTRDIALSFTSGYLIVQTDKPLYNPAQPVYVRVLAMDESMRPIKDKQLAIELISPTNMTVGRVNFEPGKSQNGFYKGEFELPPFPDFGTWTIKAKLGGKSETYAIAPIEVREFVLPTFGVDITTDTENKCILPNQENIGVTVSATYVYGKTVEGIAGLDINIRKKGDVSDPKRVVTMGRQKLRNGKAFFTVDVKKLVQGLGGQFPAEAVLELSSTVYESATGKEETGADDYIMFVNCPFKFEFSRSKTTYRKGFTYYMQIDMLHADGRPAQEMDFVIEVDGKQTRRKTRKDGQYLEQISSIQSGIIKVFAPGFEKFATELVLKPYTGASQIVVEKVEMEGSSFIRAYTDINMDQVAQYTGILTLITSRGKIVKTVYSPPMRDSSFKLEPDDEEKMSPVGRVFAFYVNNNQLIADSSFFRLQAKCRAQLELQPHTVIVKPGDAANLTVKGPSGMWVGFNVIDKALLLLNNENILKEDKIFKEMEARDLGCGAGGGTNSEEIFKNAGLTILTNANVDAKLIQRETTECDAKKRNRRSVPEENGCYYGANPVCCKGGEQYAFDVIHEYEVDKAHNLKPDIAEPVPYIVCYSKAKTLAETHQEKVPSKCPMAFFEACVVTMTAELSTSDDARGRSIFSDQDQYAKDVSALAGFGFQLKVRKHFETSFFFEEHMISGKELTTSIKFRDSITKWSLQAIGITENTGACIATPKEVSAFKEFFIQVDLPYKVSRKEHFNVKVTVFNYINKDMNARVYLKGIRGLCYGSLPGEQSPTTARYRACEWR